MTEQTTDRTEVVAAILREVFGPSPIEAPLAYDAETIANRIVRALNPVRKATDVAAWYSGWFERMKENQDA